MSRERKVNIAKALKSQLNATEEAIDTALTEAAHLIESYVSSRRAVHMSAVIANDVHQNTLRAMMALNDAQQCMTAAHQGLVKVQDQVGLTNAIPGDDKPAPKPPGGQLMVPVTQPVAAE